MPSQLLLTPHVCHQAIPGKAANPCWINALPCPLSTIPQYPIPFIFPGRIYLLDLGIVLLLSPGPSLMPRNIPEQHLPAGCCFSTLGWGCALCPDSTSPLTSWKDSTFLWKNFTPLCVSLGSTRSFVTGKLKANVQYQVNSSGLEIAGIKSSLKFFQSQKHLDAAPSIPTLSFLSCKKSTPGLTVKVLAHWGNEQEFQTLFPAS